MSRDTYISTRKNMNGFLFANIGLFTGFGASIYGSVYSLVLMDIFKLKSIIGIYISIYSLFCLIISLFMNELLKYFSKAKLFNFSLITIIVSYFMMGFSIKNGTFVVLDYISGFSSVLMYIILPLFLSDFSKKIGMEKLNSRYYFWINLGCFFAPMLAMFIASYFGNRFVFIISSLLYFMAFLMFKYFKIVQKDKFLPKKINFSKTFKTIFISIKDFIKNKYMRKAYIISFSFFTLYVMRSLYVPISVIEHGFSKGTLGVILTLGIIPYIFLSRFMGKLANKYGTKLWLIIGFLSFAFFSLMAVFADGVLLLSIFVLWQISGALMESIYELLFFDTISKKEQVRYYPIFKTNLRLSRIITPLISSIFIALLGGVWAVWIFTAIICIAAVIILIKKN